MKIIKTDNSLNLIFRNKIHTNTFRYVLKDNTIKESIKTVLNIPIELVEFYKLNEHKYIYFNHKEGSQVLNYCGVGSEKNEDYINLNITNSKGRYYRLTLTKELVKEFNINSNMKGVFKFSYRGNDVFLSLYFE